MAKILIDTNGETESTVVTVNGKPLEELKEFHFSMNPHREKNGTRISGRCKMQQGFKGEFRSYFADDFKKIDEFMQQQKEN